MPKTVSSQAINRKSECFDGGNNDCGSFRLHFPILDVIGFLSNHS
jgi:hypothetical protein